MKNMSEFRYCKLNQKWVLFAPNRLKKLDEYNRNLPKINKDECPFDLGKENNTPKEIFRINDKKGNWKCRVVPNLYNVLSIEKEPIASRDGIFEKFEGFGAHEVIIETPSHDKQMLDFTIDEFYYYLLTVQNRLKDLKKDQRLKYISIFKNSGVGAGASLPHSHSQLIALPFVPKKILNSFEYKKQYFLTKQRTLFDDIIYDERMQKKGIIYESAFFIAYLPYASEFPFEIIITSKVKKPSLIYFDDIFIKNLAEVLNFAMSKMKNRFGNFAYNMLINNSPFFDIEEQNLANIYRFHIRIMPRLYQIAGFELNTGIYINPMLPENAVNILKNIDKD